MTAKQKIDLEGFIAVLRDLTGLDDQFLDGETAAACQDVLKVSGAYRLRNEMVTNNFYARMNRKLGVNKGTLGSIYREAANAGVTFNYHTKLLISGAVDAGDKEMFRRVVSENWRSTESLDPILAEFAPASQEETRNRIIEEASKPSKLRANHNRTTASDVFNSAAGSLIWSMFDEVELVRQPHKLAGTQMPSFLEHLKLIEPQLFERSRSLVIRGVNPACSADYFSLRDDLLAWVAIEYSILDNYGHLAILIDVDSDHPTAAWELSADLTNFAEHFYQDRIGKKFFRWRQVSRETLTHNLGVDRQAAEFDVACIGFTYRDLFVLHDGEGKVSQLVVLFQKNERDETLVPCPQCRSTDVRGNSYPSLGVKSWECVNPICPDRSIYNRGKRYSFKSLLSQAAISEPVNEIPVASIRAWRRDVRVAVDAREVVSMLVAHYSMCGDVVVFIDVIQENSLPAGRTIRQEAAPSVGPNSNDFWTGPFFQRYVVTSPTTERPAASSRRANELWEIITGDAQTILSEFPDNYFDGAVTSPPYFNAREYAQWPNLYCYLYDMHHIHRELFRTLKPGAVYAFNIFDYFDNDRTINFSLMGQRRLALSALFVDLFRRIGFELLGVAVWDKGDVQGKRSFNAGNLSPFYQAPLNCWEHVLLVRKPGAHEHERRAVSVANKVMTIHPVVKMVRGENTYGHTAPFPFELPRRLLESIAQPGEIIIDPFAGSATTARAAFDLGIRSVMIERDPEYSDLALRMTEEFVTYRAAAGDQMTLF